MLRTEAGKEKVAAILSLLAVHPLFKGEAADDALVVDGLLKFDLYGIDAVGAADSGDLIVGTACFVLAGGAMLAELRGQLASLVVAAAGGEYGDENDAEEQCAFWSTHLNPLEDQGR